MEYMATVVQVVPLDGRRVCLYFSDGSIKNLDVSSNVERGGVFGKLADESFFRERLTVLNGTVAWDVSGDRNPRTCIDLDPETCYEAGIDIDDPLSKSS